MSHEERPKTAQQLGLMQGFPPPEDRLVTLANWQDAPYNNQWYNAEDAHRSFFGIGIHGQHLWIDPTANVVMVTFSTRPSAVDAVMRWNTLMGLTAIGQALG
jgi:CubicO group peptidase (beta-lactamase class C family)